MIMSKKLIGAIAIGSALAGGAAVAGPSDDISVRLARLEVENAAMRSEINALREHAASGKKPLPDRRGGVTTSVQRAETSIGSSGSAKRDVFAAYAADMPVAYKAAAPESKGVFRWWGEGGAIWSGGDRIRQTYSLFDYSTVVRVIPGAFDLIPDTGWEAATGFDYRFAGSPWHVSGQFRYGEARGRQSAATSGTTDPAVLAGLAIVPPISALSGSDTVTTNYKETHWIADLAAGRDVLGSGANAMQVKFGVRLAEFVGKTATSEVVANTIVFNPALVVPGFPAVGPASSNALTQTDTRSRFLGAGPRIGIEGSVPLGGSWAFDYLGDAAVLFGTQRLNTTLTSGVSFTPACLVNVFGTNNTFATATDQRFATVYNADIQVGISYWMTQSVKLSASYRLDAFFGVLNQTFAASTQTVDRYVHGPRVAVSAQF